MNYGGDAADQIVRYSLEGTEVALKLTGEAAKSFAVFAAAVLKDQKKMHGRTNLTRLLRDGKPLKFFVVPEERMKEFAVEANARGLLFVPVKDKTKEDGKIEIAVWAEDAAKVNRVLEKMKLDYVQADTGSKADVVTAISEKVKRQTALTPQTEVVETPAGKVAFEVGEMDDLFSVGANFTQRADSTNHSEMVAEKNPSELSSQPQNSLQPQPDKNAEKIRAEGGKPSVKQELKEIKQELTQKKAAERQQPQRQCALPGFVDSKNEEKTERNAGHLVVSHSGDGMLRQGTRKGIRRTPANRGMRAHRIVKSLDISEDVCHGLCP